MDAQIIHTNLYITHENEELLLKLVDVLNGSLVDKEKAYTIAREFNPSPAELVEELFKYKYTTDFEFKADADEEHGYYILQLQQGERGESSMVHFIEFLHGLIPGINALVWGYAEDDPWEFFIKYHNGRAIKQEHVPWEDEVMDQNAIEYIYHWWHEDLPDEIQAGLLSSDDEEVEDEDDMDKDDTDDEEYDDIQ
jgi:hypothetical protein